MSFRPRPTRPTTLALFAVGALAALASPAHAQGTAAQRAAAPEPAGASTVATLVSDSTRPIGRHANTGEVLAPPSADSATAGTAGTAGTAVRAAPAIPVATGTPPSGSAGLRNARLAAKVGAHVRLKGAALREAIAAEPALPLAFDDVPAVVRTQILLDAARFSPGIIDGWWGENLRFAVRAFQRHEGLPVSDTLDLPTYERLVKRTGGREPLVRYTVTPADVKGPYRALPGSIYDKAKASCLCYTSLLEQLSERFHTTTVVLQQLNPDVNFAKLAAGAKVVAPNVARAAFPGAPARLVVDKGEGSLRGVDAKGKTLFWLPTSLGHDDEPSPTGRLTITSITRNPQYHYNPLVLGDVDDKQKAAYLPAGPNSPVGVLWVQLSKKHVGIHGTPDPETIGPLASHGCVRLTNWDANYLAALARVGMPVEFR